MKTVDAVSLILDGEVLEDMYGNTFSLSAEDEVAIEQWGFDHEYRYISFGCDYVTIDEFKELDIEVFKISDV